MEDVPPDSREELRSLVRAFRMHLVALQESQSGFHARNYEHVSQGDAAKSRSTEGRVPLSETIPLRTVDEVREDLGDCRRCNLHSTRQNLVFGEGDPHAPLVFVGEAPGEQEDLQGRPFVGRAGQLLTDIIKAMNLSRSQVYICNILKCRPPGNRNPNPDEIAVCEPFLIRQLEAIQPKVICALGTFAAKTLLKTETPISKLRGKFHIYQGIPLMPTFHPAYLLRNPAEKKQVWNDVKMIMEYL
jgi:uracil-DNA glycosylase